MFSTADTYRVLLNLDGDFMIADDDFYWNVAASLSRVTGYFSQPSIVQTRFLNAINAVSSGGQIVCAINADAPTANDDPACRPLNLFGKGVASQAALDYITTDYRSNFNNEQKDYEANFGGDLLHLPGGNLSFNVGYEYREEAGNFKPNEAFRLGLGRSVPISPVRGEYNTSEYYIEGLLPIFGEDFNFPLMHRLELEGAFRQVDNSQSGKNDAWSYAVRYYPYSDLMLRGTMSGTFRSPSITELFFPQSSAFATATDPCDQGNITGGPNPAARTAACQAAFVALGLPANFALASQVQVATVQILTGGNPNLAVEEAESWSAGLVFQPSQVPGLTISGDWVDIELTNSIENFTLTAILSSCYDGGNAAACALFTRGTGTAQIQPGAQTGRVNAGFRLFQAPRFPSSTSLILTIFRSWRTLADN